MTKEWEIAYDARNMHCTYLYLNVLNNTWIGVIFVEKSGSSMRSVIFGLVMCSIRLKKTIKWAIVHDGYSKRMSHNFCNPVMLYICIDTTKTKIIWMFLLSISVHHYLDWLFFVPGWTNLFHNCYKNWQSICKCTELFFSFTLRCCPIQTAIRLTLFFFLQSKHKSFKNNENKNKNIN